MNISNISILIAIALINGQVLGYNNTPDNVTSRLQVQVRPR
jgi:hypothetical protein